MKIHIYAKQGNISGVAREIAHGIDIDCLDKYSFQTPLMYAVTSPNSGIDMIRFLVENGANVNAVVEEQEYDKTQETVLSLAVNSGNLDKIKFLLDAEADINYQRPDGYDVLIDTMYGRDIVNNENLIQILNLLLKRGAKVNGICNSYGETALKLASLQGRFDAVGLLLAAGADSQKLEWTELMHAIVFGSIEDVKTLVDKEVDLSIRDCWDRTPWLLSLEVGDVEKAKLILASGADRSDRGYMGETPLMYASKNNRIEVLEWLIKEGFDLEATDEFGDTALMVAAENGATDCVPLLLDAGANCNFINRNHTALMVAAENGATDCVRLLLDAGANLEIIIEHDLSDYDDDYDDREETEDSASNDLECVLTESDMNQAKTEYFKYKAIEQASNLTIVRMLVDTGEDLRDINHEMRQLLTGVGNSQLLEVSREQYLAGKHRRFGKINPEVMEIDFWKAMVRCNMSAWGARDCFDDTDNLDTPVWCYNQRFGRTITELPDRRIIEIAGEHEDFYDPDFCIYNDVVVYEGNGNFKILGYPKDIFPPTDFHSATLVGEYIYIIGNLGYSGERIFNETPVYRLHIQSFKIEKVETTGEKPGWISRHKARYQEPSKIYISGGEIGRIVNNEEEYAENLENYILDLTNLNWSRVI